MGLPVIPAYTEFGRQLNLTGRPHRLLVRVGQQPAPLRARLRRHRRRLQPGEGLRRHPGRTALDQSSQMERSCPARFIYQEASRARLKPARSIKQKRVIS